MKRDKSRLTVLLVDDEAEFLESASKVLGRRGMTVLTAANGEEALGRLSAEAVDVIVLDEKMPGMSGERLFGNIQERWPGTPVIMLTGHGTTSQAFRLTKAGIVDYLAKPADAEQLSQKIRAAAEARAGAAARASGDRPSVLLVDDERELLSSLQSVLARRGMDVATAEDGAAALKLLRERPVDVVVLDVKLPEISGLDVLKRIKQESPATEVLLLTGHPNVDDALKGVGLGAMDYLRKPVDVDALVEAIHRAHRKRQQAVEAARRETVQAVLERLPE